MGCFSLGVPVETSLGTLSRPEMQVQNKTRKMYDTALGILHLIIELFLRIHSQVCLLQVERFSLTRSVILSRLDQVRQSYVRWSTAREGTQLVEDMFPVQKVLPIIK